MKVARHFPESKDILASAESVGQNALLERYLVQLERPLLRFVPDDERLSYVEETRIHLEQAIRDQISHGESTTSATQLAINRFGSAKLNSEEFLESWFEYRARTPMSRKFGHANLIAYGLFQAVVVAYYLILQIDVFLPGEATYRIPWRLSPHQVRQVWPEPLPFPDFTLKFFLTIGWPIVAPVLAGWLVGRMVPVRASAAVYRGITPLIILSFVMGALLLPMTEGLLFALFQVAFWLPVGCFTAFVSSNLSRGWRRDSTDRVTLGRFIHFRKNER